MMVCAGRMMEVKKKKGKKRKLTMMKACLPDLHQDTLDIDPARAKKALVPTMQIRAGDWEYHT